MSMGENNGLRCYMKSPELGYTLRMHSTKWKIIWILLSFPNPGLALSSPLHKLERGCKALVALDWIFLA